MRRPILDPRREDRADFLMLAYVSVEMPDQVQQLRAAPEADKQRRVLNAGIHERNRHSIPTLVTAESDVVRAPGRFSRLSLIRIKPAVATPRHP
jgi:hypothetical protein